MEEELKSNLLVAAHPAEQGHFYFPDGRPAYTIVGKNGKERPTTLRDARKENLKPSVSGVINMAAKPGLTNWMLDQAILSALTCPKIDDEDETAYLSRIKKDSKEQAARAAERGTLIHSYVQEGFEGRKWKGEHGEEYYLSAMVTIEKECGKLDWKCEASFATDRYGGKVDLHCSYYLIDIKTSSKDLSTVKMWDEHYLQLAAYREGLKIPLARCGILHINTDTAESKITWADEVKLQRGLDMFLDLLSFWYHKNDL
jgi:hypothetical protein